MSSSINYLLRVFNAFRQARVEWLFLYTSALRYIFELLAIYLVVTN